ncbi:hypothetical protein ASE66_24645 [Bosea sp. Root483D1]|nr:KGG domain-containing protein [Bosea sp. Root483D1]KRE11830.1 hypothetical protein ASE66_24645 [Bosea sp. Root483D1]
MANNQGFANDPKKASEAGKKGGERSHRGQQTAYDRERRQSGLQDDTQRGGAGNFANVRERASEAGRKGGQS